MPFDGSKLAFVPSDEGLVCEDRPSSARVKLRRVLHHLFRAPREGKREVSMLEVAAVLSAARELIEPERSWLRGQYHRFHSRFCAIGALRRVGHHASPAVVATAHTLLLSVARQRGFETVERMNDRSIHPEVLSAFDAAIAVALG